MFRVFVFLRQFALSLVRFSSFQAKLGTKKWLAAHTIGKYPKTRFPVQLPFNLITCESEGLIYVAVTTECTRVLISASISQKYTMRSTTSNWIQRSHSFQHCQHSPYRVTLYDPTRTILPQDTAYLFVYIVSHEPL